MDNNDNSKPSVWVVVYHDEDGVYTSVHWTQAEAEAAAADAVVYTTIEDHS